jgi:hypothetical protein
MPDFDTGINLGGDNDAELGNIDGDETPDVVLAGDDAVTVFFNGGDGTFSTSVELGWATVQGTGPDSNAIEVSVADLDQDGLDDIVALTDSGEILTWVNPGAPAVEFGDPVVVAEPALAAEGGEPHDGKSQVVDFDGDGDLDLAVTMSSAEATGALVVYLGDGAGGFVPAGMGFDIGNPSGHTLAVGAFDDDATVDVVVSVQRDTLQSDLVLLTNDGLVMGELQFAPPMILVTDITDPWVAAADFDDDGDDDVVYTRGATNELVLMINDGGTLTPMGSFDTPDGPAGIAVADVDLDCLPDVVAGSFAGDGSILLNTGTGSFDELSFFHGSPARNIRVADLTGSGFPDLLLNFDTPGGLRTQLARP